MVSQLDEMRTLSKSMMEIELNQLRKISLALQENSKELMKFRDAQTRQYTLQGSSSLSVASHYAGVQPKWEEWCTEKVACLNQESANLRVKMEKQRQKAKKAFGRVEAITRLVEREADERKRKLMSKRAL